LNSKDGLSQNIVYHILQDSSGLMWFTTQVGVDRFDGRKVEEVKGLDKGLTKSFTLLFEYDQEKLLVAIGTTFYFIDKKTLQATEIKSPLLSIPSDPIGLFKLNADSFNIDQHFLLITEKNYYFLSKDFQKLSPPLLNEDTPFTKDDQSFTTAVKAAENRYLLGTQAGLFTLKVSKDIYGLLPLNNTNFNISALTMLNDSIVWIGTDSMKVIPYNFFSKTPLPAIVYQSNDDHIVPSKVTSIFYEKEKYLWVGTEKSGIFKFRESDKALKFHTDHDHTKICHANCLTHQQITSNGINTIMSSKDGVVWVGTNSGGVNYWQKNQQEFQHHFRGQYFGDRQFVGRGPNRDTVYQYENHALGLLALENNRLLVGCQEDGLDLVDIHSDFIIQQLSPSDKHIGGKTVYSIVEGGKDSILLGTSNGIYFLDKRKLNIEQKKGTYTLIPSFREPTSILFYDNTNKRWWLSARTEHKVIVTSSNFRVAKTDTLHFNEEEQISFIQKIPFKGALCPMVVTTKRFYIYPYPEDLTRTISKSTNFHITSATPSEDSLSLWFGTDRRGLYKYDLATEAFVDSITVKDGLKTDVIYSIIRDTFNNLWCSTNHGIFHISHLHKIINQYDEQSGLKNGEFNSGSVSVSPDRSTYFFGGIDGVFSFQPTDILSKEDPSKEDFWVKINYPALRLPSTLKLDYKGAEQNPIALPNQFNYLELDFTSSSFHNPLNNQYRVQLKDSLYYVENGTLRLAQDLFADNFPFWGKEDQLKIQYRSGNGNWSKSTLITIDRQFWTTFRVAVGLIGLFFIAIIIGLSLRSANLKAFSEVQQRINEISRLESIEEMVAKTKNYLIKEFDYVVFSFVDFNKKRITSVDSIHKSDKVDDPKLWLKDSDYPLSAEDILAQVVRTGETVIVFRNQILNPKIHKLNALHPEITKKYQHEKLARLYIPIKHRALNEHSNTFTEGPVIEDSVMGVIEAGYKLTPWEYPTAIGKFILRLFPDNTFLGIKLNPLEYIKNKQVRLQLYVDNFSQPYYRAFLKKNRRDFYETILDDCELKYTNHMEFIKKVLDGLAETIGADFGNISIRTFNNERFEPHEMGLFYNYDAEIAQKGTKTFEKRNKNKNGIIQHVSKTKTPYYTGDAEHDEYFIRIIGTVESEMTLPMKDKFDVVYGVFTFSSIHSNYFNSVMVDTLKKVIEKTTEAFIKKKEANTMSQLMAPFDIFSRSHTSIYRNAVKALQHYFNSEFICVWGRDVSPLHNEPADSSNTTRFKLSSGSLPGFKKLYDDYGLSRVALPPESIWRDSKNTIQLIHVDEHDEDSKIYNFCTLHQFKSYIILRITIEDRVEAFIEIFSKRKIGKNEVSQYSREFLTNFIKKVNAAIQSVKLVKSFERISASLSRRHSESSLQVIVDQAYELTPSTDSVVLFPYKGYEIKVKDLLSAGNIPEVDRKYNDKKANIANYVIEHGTQWIMSEKANDELVAASKPLFPERDTFWKINSLESVAAVRLEYNTAPIGVMIFNYSKKMDFTDDSVKRTIEAFINFATTALINDDFIQRIQKETQKLSRKNKELAENKIRKEEEINLLQRDIDMFDNDIRALASDKNRLLEEKEVILKEKKILMKEKEVLVKEQKILARDKKTIEIEHTRILQAMDEILPRAARTSYFLILQGVNHDIRNYLLGIDADHSALIEVVTSKAKAITEEIIRNTKNTIKFVDILLDLFNFTGIRDKEAIKINEVILQVINFFKHKDKLIKFDVNHLQKDIPGLICMKAEFAMIIYNLVNNAVQAMNYSGKMKITSKYADKNYIITIEDKGIGIDKGDQEKIFDIHYTTRKHGLGIGLYFVKETIENSFEGKIEVNSSKGKGATFTITIPEYINYKK